MGTLAGVYLAMESWGPGPGSDTRSHMLEVRERGEVRTGRRRDMGAGLGTRRGGDEAWEEGDDVENSPRLLKGQSPGREEVQMKPRHREK